MECTSCLVKYIYVLPVQEVLVVQLGHVYLVPLFDLVVLENMDTARWKKCILLYIVVAKSNLIG